MRETVTIGGSHGELTVDRATGTILDRPEGYCCEDCDGPGYGDIARFDPVVFEREREFDHFDILGTAYWTHDGTFVEGLTIRTVTGPFMLRGRVHHADNDFDDWVPLALLPAPKPRPRGPAVAFLRRA